jgi:hypothetical protein
MRERNREPDGDPVIQANVIEQAAEIRHRFQGATPFRHVAIDDFLDAGCSEALLRDFPPFDPKRATDERGRTGRKAVVERVSGISPAYGAFYRYINSAPFLSAMSALTGIPDLIADETLFGGGTHENLNGQGLDVHIDFNIDERTMLHRRVNLLVYLNKVWDERWGGAIELHSNPRRPELDASTSFLPLFNRAVIFETNEYSWHGFKRIELPAGREHLSRKSFSIYLYTKERPAADVAAPHTTFYVPEPLPRHLAPGHTLTETDFRDLQRLMASREGLLEMYQELLVAKQQRLQDLMRLTRENDYGTIVSSRTFRLLMIVHRLRYRLRRLLARHR